LNINVGILDGLGPRMFLPLIKDGRSKWKWTGCNGQFEFSSSWMEK
jgi:hypothetical protein